MSPLRTLVCIAAVAVLPAAAAPFRSSAPAHSPADSLGSVIAARLDSLAGALADARATVAVCVADAADGRRLYARDERRSLRPASCQKVVTAWAALATLGTRHLFHTRLAAPAHPADSLLDGPLYALGEMDPLLSRADLRALADTLAARGVRAIGGDLVVDTSYKDSARLGRGWCWDDDNPALLPLLVDGREGFGSALAEALGRAGIEVRGRVRTGQAPAGLVTLADCPRTLDEVLLPMMKDSRNLCAETLFYALDRGPRPATAARAADVVAGRIAGLGLRPADYRAADGSGLSLYNYASAELLCEVLGAAWRDDACRRHLEPALPVAGVDGTLARRMRGGPAEGRVRAKTGTLSGVSTLAGYATAADGRTLAFAIFCSGHLPGSTFRRLQDALCEAMTAP